MPASSGRSANACGRTMPGSPRIVIATSVCAAIASSTASSGAASTRTESRPSATVTARSDAATGDSPAARTGHHQATQADRGRDERHRRARNAGRAAPIRRDPTVNRTIRPARAIAPAPYFSRIRRGARVRGSAPSFEW